MSNFKINIESITEKPDIINDIASQYEACIESLNSVITKMSYNSAYQDIVSALNKLSSGAEKDKKMLYVLAAALGEIVTYYETTEKKILKEDDKQEVDNTEENQESHEAEDFLKMLMDILNNGGSVASGVAAGLKGLAEWAKPFLDAGFKIKMDGKYIKVIFGSNQIKKLLGFRHKYKISDIGKLREIDELFKFDKMLKAGKFVDKLSKIGNGLAILGIGLDVTGGILENYNKDADWHEYVGDATVDVAVGAGGFFVASAATEVGATAGAAIGTIICPGVGTVIGGVIGGVGGAVVSSAAYNEVISGDCFGLLPEGESIEQYAKDGCNWLGEKAEEGAEWIGDKAEELWDGIGDSLGNFSLGW